MGDTVMWDASGLRPQLRPGGERLSAISPSVPPLMWQEEYTFVCLAIQLLHRTLGGRGKMNGEDNISSSFVCKWSVRTHTEMPYKTQRTPKWPGLSPRPSSR